MTKRQRKDLETTWKKERQELQKQLQQSQQTMKDLQKQITHRDAPNHLTEKINVLMTENELLLSKIKELEHVVDDVQLLRSEMLRLRDKNSSDWNYWRKQQNDVYAQLRQQQTVKDAILNRFDRLQKQVRFDVVRGRSNRFSSRSKLATVRIVSFVISALVPSRRTVSNRTRKQAYRASVEKHCRMSSTFSTAKKSMLLP